MTSRRPTGIERWLEMRGVSEADVLARYRPAPRACEPGVGYGQLAGLTRIQTGDGHFYFREGRFVVLYVNDWELDKSGAHLTCRQLRAALGAPAMKGPSSVTRGHLHYVYPALGIAFSGPLDGVDFVEVFLSTDLAGYEAAFGRPRPMFFR